MFSVLPEDLYFLDVYALGYKREQRRISASNSTFHDDTLRIMIALQPDVVRLSGVTAIGTRLSESGSATQQTTTIMAAELERARGQTLGDALKNVAGVTLLQTGPSIAKPVIRGLHSQRVVVVNAGVAQEGQQWGAEHAPEIDPFAPAKIEVVRGAAGVEYGVGAIGGVVRVVPRELRSTSGIAGELVLNGFSNNWQGAASGFVEGGFDTTSLLHGFGWRVQGSGRRAGDARAAEYMINNTGFQELNASVAVGYAEGRFGCEAYYSLFTTELGIFRGSHIGNINDLLRAIENGRPFVTTPFSYDIRPPKQQISHDLWSVRSFYKFESGGTLEAQYGWQFNRRSEFDAHNARVRDSADLQAALTRPAMTLDLATTSLDVKFRHAPVEAAGGTWTGTAGVHGLVQSNTRTGRVYLIPDFFSWGGGLYALENYAVGDWLFNAGVRFDTRSTHVSALDIRSVPDTVHAFASLTGALGVLWRFAGGAENQGVAAERSWSLACNLASGWRPPLVNEQYSNDVHHGTAQFEIGDPTLTVERSYSCDLTVRHDDQKGEEARIDAECSVYMNYLNGFIFLQPDAANPTVTVRGTFPTMRYRQTNALLRGVDGRIVWSADENWRLGGTLSIVRGDNLITNEPLIFMPADRARLFVRWEAASLLGLKDCTIEVASTLVRRQDRVPANADYAPPPAGYVLFDASASGVTVMLGTILRWNVSVQNALNASYRDYLSRFRYFTDDTGINVILRLAVPFGVL